MRRGNRARLAGRLATGSGALALILLLVAPPLARVGPLAHAASTSCTGWTDEFVPPATIRVYRTLGPARGSVQVVPFRSYVASVLAAEFGAGTPVEAMRAGAVAVKDFGWYYTMVWRGRSAPHGGCYDVVDNTWDQLYWPERFRPVERQLDAVRDTWRASVRKNGSFLLTGYRNGTPGAACGSDADGWRLYQMSAYDCARRGMLFGEILRTYYGPDFELVIPGVHDPSGDGLGEIGVALPSPIPAAPVGSFYTVIPADPAAPTLQPAEAAPATPEPVTAIGWQLADVNGDGRADVIRLERAASGAYRIAVELSTGDGFGPAATWWTDAGGGSPFPPGAAVQLLTGDFDGDGVEDAALLESVPGTPPSVAADGTVVPEVVPEARLRVLRSDRTGFEAPVLAWTGPVDASRSRAFGADVTGDGRADLVIQAPLYPQDQPPDAAPVTPAAGPDGTELPIGTRYLVAPSSSELHVGGIGPWLDVPGVTPDEAKTVVTDVNRDGRSDLVVLRPWATGGSQLVGLVSSGTSFGPRVMWSGGTFRWSAAKIAAADVNGDGRGDVVALYDAGSTGTRFYQFLSTGFAFRAGTRVTDPAIPWADAVPF